MKEKSMKNIRQEFKDNGIYYTPKALAEKLKSYIGNHPHTVYDPTCGSGNLLNVWPDNMEKYGQELDAEQLHLITLPNFLGFAGDTLADDKFCNDKFDAIVANPPFSIKWNPDTLKDDPRFKACPVMPPPSKADWAFMLHILYHLSDDGVAAVLCFPGILYRGQREGGVRRWFADNNYIDRVVSIPGNTFVDTSIATCIVVLKKHRDTTDIMFEDEKQSRTVTRDEVAGNSYNLSPNIYLPDDTPKEEIDINEVNHDIVSSVLGTVEATFEMAAGASEWFDDDFCLDELRKGLKEILEKYGA